MYTLGVRNVFIETPASLDGTLSRFEDPRFLTALTSLDGTLYRLEDLRFLALLSLVALKMHA